MKPLSELPAVPTMVVEKLAEYRITTVERLLRRVARDDARADLEHLVGAAPLRVAVEAAQAWLAPAPEESEEGEDAQPDAAPEPPATPAPPRPQAPARQDPTKEQVDREAQWAEEAARRRRQQMAAMGRPGGARKSTAHAPARPSPTDDGDVPGATLKERAGGFQGAGPGRLPRFRQRLTAASMRRWQDCLDVVADELLGERVYPTETWTGTELAGKAVVLTGVDPKKQYGSSTREPMLAYLDSQRRWWAIDVNEAFRGLVGYAREAQREFGWPQEGDWDVIARLRGVDYTYGSMEVADSRIPHLSVEVILLRDQFAVLMHPERGPTIQGLLGARKKLAEQAEAVVLPDAASPDDLLGVLGAALQGASMALLQRLFAPDRSERDVRTAYDQFVAAWQASDGDIRPVRFEPPWKPGEPSPATLKVYYRRTNTDGSVVNRPLTWVATPAGWRIRAGML